MSKNLDKKLTNKKRRDEAKERSATMPSINNYSSRDDWEIACWQKILESKELIKSLITVHERRDLVMRAACLNLLGDGKSYKQISEELWLSPQTISGIKKAISEKNYRSYLERSKKERKKKKYSIIPASPKTKPRGIPRRTKYGTIYMPY